MGKDGRGAKRVTTTITGSQHEHLKEVADEMNVAEAWLVRKAVTDLLVKHPRTNRKNDQDKDGAPRG